MLENGLKLRLFNIRTTLYAEKFIFKRKNVMLSLSKKQSERIIFNNKYGIIPYAKTESGQILGYYLCKINKKWIII